MAVKFIRSAIKKPGALTASAKRVGQSPMAFAESHKHDSGKPKEKVNPQRDDDGLRTNLSGSMERN